ncbi:SRPBCC family protein [Altererythrobacter sp. ZODW24]|uniref:SRPBCC family protein n=1 Tax=Altererythrobacter sp. ZODW24 TaxID=2185142 RepID=UPI000DF83253|nr:SRPBCC family protein [Altererythrobacter sp. ZODW24]
MKRTILGLAAGMACIAAQSASAEVVKSDESGFETRNTAVTTATPYEVWQRLLVPGKWWSDDHTWSGESDNMYISAQGGGCFCELLPAAKDAPEGIRRGSVEHMRVLQSDPPRVLRMVGTLGPLQSEPMQGVLTITLKPVDEGTRVLFEYVVGGYSRYEPDVISAAVDGVMLQQLTRLVRSLGAATGGEAEGPADEGAAEDAVDGDEAVAGEAATGETANEDKPASPLDSEDFLLEPGK